MGLGLGLGLWNGSAPASGGSARGGTNLLTGSTVTPGGSVTYNSGTGVFTVPSSSNVLATWTTTNLSPSTSYTLTLSYALTGGSNLRATDDLSNNYGVGAINTDGATHTMTISFTTGASPSHFQIVADSGLYGPGTISNVVLTSP